MDRPSIKPLAIDPSAGPGPSPTQATPASSRPASPKPARRIRPGWKPTLLRRDTFRRLRDLQKSMVDPALDLSYLSDACVQLALEQGLEAIVNRALADLKPTVLHR